MNNFLLLILTIIIASCATPRRSGSVDIPRDQTPMQLADNGGFYSLSKNSSYIFEEIYKREATDLLIYSLYSEVLKKDIKILAYDNIKASYGIFSVPISKTDEIQCGVNQKLSKFKDSIKDNVKEVSRERNIFLNKKFEADDRYYEEHISYKVSGRRHYIGMHLYRFITVNHPLVKSLSCNVYGLGNRNTLITISDDLKKQIEGK